MRKTDYTKKSPHKGYRKMWNTKIRHNITCGIHEVVDYSGRPFFITTI